MMYIRQQRQSTQLHYHHHRHSPHVHPQSTHNISVFITFKLTVPEGDNYPLLRSHMESSPLNLLPHDTLLQIFRHLSLPQIAAVRCVCRSLNTLLASPQNLQAQLSLPLLSLKPSSSSHSRYASPHPTLHAFDPCSNRWLRFNLDFLPYTSLHPITSSRGLLYLWASNGLGKSDGFIPQQQNNTQKALVVCNPLTRKYKTLPQLGSAWSRHGSVLTGSTLNVVLVLTELAILYYNPDNYRGNSALIPDKKVSFAANTVTNWLKFTSNLPSKPRSPVLISDFILALCDVGSPWRSLWAMFKTQIFNRDSNNNYSTGMKWERVEKKEWGDILDVLKRPRLVRAGDDNKKVFMVGGLNNSYALQSSCTTIVILRLDLETLEWEEASRMPNSMYRCFSKTNKFKAFGGGNRVCFSAKWAGKLALWEEFDDGWNRWRWVESVPGGSDGLCRGFVFDARLDAVP